MAREGMMGPATRADLDVALYRSLDAIREAIRAYRARIADDAGDMPSQRAHAALVDVLEQAERTLPETLARHIRERETET